MDQKTGTIFYGILAGILLIIAMIGIVITTNLQNFTISLDSARSLSILGLALLSIGLFYRNHATKIEKMCGGKVLGIIGWLCLIFFVLTIAIALGMTKFTYTLPIFMALLAIGLFLGNYVMNQNP